MSVSLPVQFQYLAILGLCLVGTAFLEFRFDARIYRRPVRVVRSLIVPFLLFNLANEAAVFRELWWYSPKYTTGFRVPRDYPIEEVGFFVAIPLCALLTFEAARAVYAGRVDGLFGRRFARPSVAPSVDETAAESAGLRSLIAALLVAGSGVLLLVELWWHRSQLGFVRNGGKRAIARTDGFELPEYPLLILMLLGGVMLLEMAWWRTHIFRMRAYWVTMAICLGFMVPMNGWLTKLTAPIVIYAEDEFSGLRPIWDIPLEDFGFGIALLTLVLMSWMRTEKRSQDGLGDVRVIG
jgi:lycopene cyclase domain-containing protein